MGEPALTYLARKVEDRESFLAFVRGLATESVDNVPPDAPGRHWRKHMTVEQFFSPVLPYADPDVADPWPGVLAEPSWSQFASFLRYCSHQALDDNYAELVGGPNPGPAADSSEPGPTDARPPTPSAPR